MEEINVKVNISDVDMNLLANDVYESIEGRIEDQINSMDLDSTISDYMRNYFDINEYLYNVNYYDIALNLLQDYNPGTNCETGAAFTSAVAKAIHWIFLHGKDDAMEYNYIDILKAIDSAREDISKKEEYDQMRAKYFREFTEELERYAKEINKEQS